MTPAQHRALERLADATLAGSPLTIDTYNTDTTIGVSTARALCRRGLAVSLSRFRITATPAGIELAATSEPVEGTR